MGDQAPPPRGELREFLRHETPQIGREFHLRPEGVHRLFQRQNDLHIQTGTLQKRRVPVALFDLAGADVDQTLHAEADGAEDGFLQSLGPGQSHDHRHRQGRRRRTERLKLEFGGFGVGFHQRTDPDHAVQHAELSALPAPQHLAPVFETAAANLKTGASGAEILLPEQYHIHPRASPCFRQKPRNRHRPQSVPSSGRVSITSKPLADASRDHPVITSA